MSSWRKPLMYLLMSGLLLVLAGCGLQASRAPTVEGSATPGPTTMTPTTGATSGGYDDLVAELRGAGATVEPAGEIEQPFFPVKGQLIRANGVDVQVFEFASAADRQAVSETISESGSQIGTSMVDWVDQPNFWARDRLIVLYVGTDTAALGLLTGVLGQPITRPSGEGRGVDDNLTAKAVLDAQAWLAERLGFSTEQIRLVEATQEQWSDSCLGLGGPAESCLQVITPGWRAIFEVNGQQYEVRTNESGSVIRLAEESGRGLPTTPSTEAPLANTRWELVSFGTPGAETPVIEGSTVTLEFQSGGQAGGSGGCNSYGGTYRVEDSRLSFQEIVSTLRACTDERLNEQEQRYYDALRSAGTFELTADSLTIQYDNGQEVLHFTRASAA